MSSIFAGDPVGRLNPQTVTGIGTLASVSGLTVSHKSLGTQIQSTFTLTNVAQSVVNGTEYQSTLLFTFPKGKISNIGSELTIAQKTTSILADTLNASSTGAISLGTAAASNVALTTTMANFVPSTAFTSSATINVAGTAVTGYKDEVADDNIKVLDGSSTAKALYLNTAYATTGDVDADATQTLTGTIVVVWQFWGGTVASFEA
jgi:hypothetical protein